RALGPHIADGLVFCLLHLSQVHRGPSVPSDNVRARPSDARRSCFVLALVGGLGGSSSCPPQSRSRPWCAGRAVRHGGQSARSSPSQERTAGTENRSRSSATGRSSSSRDSRKKIPAGRSCPRQ